MRYLVFFGVSKAELPMKSVQKFLKIAILKTLKTPFHFTVTIATVHVIY